MYCDQKQIWSPQDWWLKPNLVCHHISNQIFNFPITKLGSRKFSIVIHGDWIFWLCPKKQFVGCLKKFIQSILAIDPTAKIFFCHCPKKIRSVLNFFQPCSKILIVNRSNWKFSVTRLGKWIISTPIVVTT